MQINENQIIYLLDIIKIYLYNLIMFNKNLKLVLTALIVITAVWQFTESNIGNGIFLILLSLIFVLLYFKNEIILLNEVIIYDFFNKSGNIYNIGI